MENRIETERLILRNYKISDLDDYYQYVSNPKVGPMAGWNPYTSIDKAKERLEIEMSKPLQFAIELKENHKVIGSIEIMDTKKERMGIEIDPNSKEIGAILSEEYWGKGIMPEALKAIMEYCFNVLNVDVVYAGHVEANKQSARLQEKCGLEVIGRRQNYRTWIDGEQTDLIIRCKKRG